jgi:formate dehydrogenase major subunit/formate dehydrogenase alpha subunit
MDGLLDALRGGRIRALHVIGDSPAFDAEALEALSQAEFLVVQDAFLSEAAHRADVVLPSATFAEKEGTYTNLERRVQLLRRAVEPRGEAQPDWWTLCRLAQEMGSGGFGYSGPAQVMTEIAGAVPLYGGVSHQRLESGGLQWPCPSPDHPGTPTLYQEGFPGGKAQVVPITPVRVPSRTTSQFPFLLVPGRVLAVHDQEVNVLRGEGLNRIQREQPVEVHPEDAQAARLADGDVVEVVTSGARFRGRVRASGSLRGVVAFAGLFGELATTVASSRDPDPMLRVPGLEVAPARLERVENG